ncbi:TPA: hypothetical protein DEX28_01050 [Patescibacteria group bacterium]|nr:MAG: Teichoic-acid-transporting ATPase [Candidatus Woesebacteria bacterium GW2011_GWC1_42_9]HCI05315.1 hypothetical protein [Patescibacteria group bacterium]
MKPVIEIKNLSKQYTIYHNRPSYYSLRDELVSIFKKKDSQESFWALDNISFDVNRGEIFGVIGPNGAGKSTLLKVLSRITPPTKGKVVLRGRVGSLLEVGTGFHPELSGRENVFLNGALLGMTRKEISKKFDEIVDFAGVEKFLDTPVKFYSSGMYVRLAFAVAAHLESDILLVDEVLAVGDAEFQKKCLGKMEEVTQKQGRTILFVSHNMDAIQSLCDRAVLFNQGVVVFDGAAHESVSRYLNIGNSGDLKNRGDRRGSGAVRFTRAWVENEKGEVVVTVSSGQTIRLVAEYFVSSGNIKGDFDVAFALNSSTHGQLSDLSPATSWGKIADHGKIICELPNVPLNVGVYSFNICARVDKEIADWVLDVATFNVISGTQPIYGKIPDKDQGCFLFEQKWDIKS